MSLSRVDEAILAVSEEVSSSDFGERLKKFHPGTRSMSGRPMDLAGFELGRGPAIGRALQVVHMVELGNHSLTLSHSDKAYLEFVGHTLRFLSALSSEFWRPIRPDLYTLPIGDDDLPAFASNSIPGLRSKHPPKLASAADSLGLSGRELKSWSALAASCRAAPTYARAREVADGLKAERKHFRRLLQWREAEVSGFRSIVDEAGHSGHRTVLEVRESLRLQLDETIEKMGPERTSLSRYAALVQACIIAVLGFAERAHPLRPIYEIDEPVWVNHDRRRLSAHLVTTADYILINTLTPFLVQVGGPLDGVFICLGYSIRGLGDGGFTDLIGERIANLAET